MSLFSYLENLSEGIVSRTENCGLYRKATKIQLGLELSEATRKAKAHATMSNNNFLNYVYRTTSLTGQYGNIVIESSKLPNNF